MTAVVTPRIAAFDRLRGLIIVLMALDHASFFIARVHPAETWAAPPPYYADAAAFVTRWLTHLCAPGFFLLMGIGMVLFADSRRAAGWAPWRVTRYLATRGFVLLVVQHVLENPAWLLGIVSAAPGVEQAMGAVPGPGGETMASFAVLSALGFAMIVGSVMWRAPGWAILLAVLLLTRIPDLFALPPSAALDPQPFWKQLLFVPGATGVVQVMYPWVIWLFPMLGGLSIARRLTGEPTQVSALLWPAGVFLLVLFALMRWLGIGDAHAMGPGVIGWLTVTKYPPSHAFFAITLGSDLLLLAALMRWPVRWMAPLEVFGRTPFFFYLAHLWLLGALSWLFPSGASFPVMYGVWLGVVLMLFPACRRYALFKNAKPPTSFWRMF